MTVFGFGRKGHENLVEHIGELTEVPKHYTIGITNNTKFEVTSTAIKSAYKPVKTSIDDFEENIDE